MIHSHLYTTKSGCFIFLQKPGKEEAKKGSDVDEDDNDDDDIEAALEKEVSELKSVQKHERRFQQVESGATNCIFIRTTLPDPTELVTTIFSDIYQSETAKSRYIMRLLPIIGTCKCSEDKVKKLAEETLKGYFTDAIGHTFSVNIKVRNNNSFGRKQVLPLLVDVVKDLNLANHPNLDEPEYIVNVDILRNVLCLSVLKDSVKFRKYNLQEVVTAKAASEKPKLGDKSFEEAAKKADDGEIKESNKPSGEAAKGEEEGTVKESKDVTENNKCVEKEIEINESVIEEIMDSTKDKEERSEPEKSTDDTSQAADKNDEAADNNEATGDVNVPPENPCQDVGSEKGADEGEKSNE